MNLYPKITRPTWITSRCATLTDSIFTNDILHNTGISDISDYLLVFTVYDKSHQTNQPHSKTVYRRVRTEESIKAFENDSMAQNWDIIYNDNDISSAYNEFLRIFKRLYSKNCPIEKNDQETKICRSSLDQMGLQNACKKKNTLYREFIGQRTKEVENKYKNKLTNITRTTKKEYYINY